MGTHVVVGAGGIGRAAARHLVARGHEVVMATRSGTDPQIEGVRPVTVDAADPSSLEATLRGADTLVNAVNPARYDRWERDWPPVAAAMLTAAERTGAGLVTVSNLYGYGPVDGPMSEDTPAHPHGTKGRVRATMWADALGAHQAGRVRATELRASDYFGPGSSPRTSVLNAMVIGRAAVGRSVWLISGGSDVPHSWTYLDDIGALAAALATDDRSWGRAWHVPTAEPRTAREVAADVARLVGRSAPAVRELPVPVRALARVSATVRELDETRYQFDRPFVLDSTLTGRTFALQPTPWERALAETVTWLGRGAALVAA
ncbi:MAG: NAD(P)H-binding protein [Actinobacteria bacterium]|nr:NAD(P)H-binding protein [Actinomycetota bacterium]MCG2797016.1 NAD(P)H-binding protein [Cellulomonas sp.]